MDIQSWTSPSTDNALDDRRAELDRFESTLSKIEGDLGFERLAAVRPEEDVLRSTVTLLKIARATPPPTLGDGYCSQILSQLIDPRIFSARLCTSLLIADSPFS